MGTNNDTYILIGAEVGHDWGTLPTDGQGDQDASDDWHDRHSELVIYRPKKGDIVFIDDMDSAHWGYIGRVVDVNHSRDQWYTTFFVGFDVERLSREIAEVSAILLEKYGITQPVKLHIVSRAC